MPESSTLMQTGERKGITRRGKQGQGYVGFLLGLVSNLSTYRLLTVES